MMIGSASGARVCSAHAEVILIGCDKTDDLRSLLRTRGGDPRSRRYAVFASSRLLRTRGGDPEIEALGDAGPESAPHTRR